MKIHIRIKPSSGSTVELDETSWYLTRIFNIDQLVGLCVKLKALGFYWMDPYDMDKGCKPLIDTYKTLQKEDGEAYVSINVRMQGGKIYKRGMAIHLYSEAQDFKNNKHRLVQLPICSLLNNEIKLI